MTDQQQAAYATVAKPGFFVRMLVWLLRFCRRNIFSVVPVAILLIALGYYYYQYQNLLSKSPANAQAQAQEQTRAVVTDIEKLMYIADDSGAQLATISDITKLQGQKFFENAKNGDDLVLFPAAQQAILYRPSTHKIVQVGPFTPGTGSTASSAASGTKAPATQATSTKTR